MMQMIHSIFTRGCLTAASLFVLALPTAVYAKEDKAPLVLQPASPWNLDYADDSCRLARIFGEAEQKTAFYIERYAPGDRFFLVVAGSTVAGSRPIKTELSFGPGGRTHTADGQTGTFGDYGPALLESGMALMPLSNDGKIYRFDAEEIAADPQILKQEILPAQEASIEWLQIERGSKQPVRLALGSMDKPMAAMRACTDQLLTAWGIDVEAHNGLTRRVTPRADPGGWLTSSDYPSGLAQNGVQGLVRPRLSVGTDGVPTQCYIQRSTQPEGFDKAVCAALMKKARFNPALDAAGQPLASYWQSTVRFEIGR